MSTDLDNRTLMVLEKIGKTLRDQRKLNSDLDYKAFAQNELKIGMNTYLRMEQGSGDYNISNLIKVTSYYPEFKLSKFLEEAGL